MQAVADYFIAPNGIELSPDWKHVYVTDTGSQKFPNEVNLTDPANIYRFDITADGKRLANRQVFAWVEDGFPDGIHTDTMVSKEYPPHYVLRLAMIASWSFKGMDNTVQKADIAQGNVYSGVGNGVSVWSPQGVLLGKFAVASDVNNFAFVPVSDIQRRYDPDIESFPNQVYAKSHTSTHLRHFE